MTMMLFMKQQNWPQKNLDEVIDINFYPTDKTERSNNKHRPIGLGIQGLADVYFKLGIAYDSEEAKEINKLIFVNNLLLEL